MNKEPDHNALYLDLKHNRGTHNVRNNSIIYESRKMLEDGILIIKTPMLIGISPLVRTLPSVASVPMGPIHASEGRRYGYDSIRLEQAELLHPGYTLLLQLTTTRYSEAKELLETTATTVKLIFDE